MDRRRFLVSTALSGAALSGVGAAFSSPAKALSVRSCDGSREAACLEAVRHRELVLELAAVLDRKGIGKEEKERLLAAATCPFCGLPLGG